MGKATITENKGAGRYTIEINQGLEEKNKKIATLNDRRIKLETKLFPLENRRGTLEIEIQGELSASEGVITERYLRLTAEYDIVVTQIGYFKIQIESIARQISYYSTITGVLVKDAWCVDYTDQASGVVATIEVPDEPQLTLIAPGAVAPGPGDGRILARAFQDPNQVYLNAAILPGILKWRPNYRRGTINSVDKNANTANVTLAAAEMESGDPVKFNLNVSTELINVPIQYLDCNSDVFEAGDQVIVQFTDRKWDQPKIIGFVTDPKECSQGISFTYTGNHYIYKKWIFPTGQLLNGSWEAAKYFNGYLDTVDKFQSGDDILYVAYNKWPHCIRPGLVHPNSSNIRVYDENNFYYPGYLPSNISGLSAKKVDGKWYVFAAVKIREYYNYNPPLNNLRLYRGELLENNGYYYMDWVIISTFEFGGLKTLPNRTYPETYLQSVYWQSAPTSFNQSCTQAYQLIEDLFVYTADHRTGTPSTVTDGSYAVKFIINGISATNEIVQVSTITSSASLGGGGTNSPQNYGPRDYGYDYGPREFWGTWTYNYTVTGTGTIAIDFVGDTLTLLTTNYTYNRTYVQVETRSYLYPDRPYNVYYQTNQPYNSPMPDNYGFVNSSNFTGSLVLNWGLGSATFSISISSSQGTTIASPDSGDKYIIGWDPKCDIITWVDWKRGSPTLFKVNDTIAYTYPTELSVVGGSGFTLPSIIGFSAYGNLFSCARFNQTYHMVFRAPLPSYQESYYIIEAANNAYNAGYKLTEDMIFFRSSDNSVSKAQVSASLPNGLIEQAPTTSAPNRVFYNFYRIYITFKN